MFSRLFDSRPNIGFESSTNFNFNVSFYLILAYLQCSRLFDLRPNVGFESSTSLNETFSFYLVLAILTLVAQCTCHTMMMRDEICVRAIIGLVRTNPRAPCTICNNEFYYKMVCGFLQYKGLYIEDHLKISINLNVFCALYYILAWRSDDLKQREHCRWDYNCFQHTRVTHCSIAVSIRCV